MILAIKHAAKNHQERIKSMNSLGEGHWAALIIGMVNSHMAEYTDIPPIPFSLNKAIDNRECKPLRKKNSVFIDAKSNAASKAY